MPIICHPVTLSPCDDSCLPFLLLYQEFTLSLPGFCLPCSPNEDSERYPPVIWEAKCRHLFCVNAEGKLDHHLNSVAIQQEILVLRREPRHCPHSFRLEKMLVDVGCTCVKPMVLQAA